MDDSVLAIDNSKITMDYTSLDQFIMEEEMENQDQDMEKCNSEGEEVEMIETDENANLDEQPAAEVDEEVVSPEGNASNANMVTESSDITSKNKNEEDNSKGEIDMAAVEKAVPDSSVADIENAPLTKMLLTGGQLKDSETTGNNNRIYSNEKNSENLSSLLRDTLSGNKENSVEKNGENEVVIVSSPLPQKKIFFTVPTAEKLVVPKESNKIILTQPNLKEKIFHLIPRGTINNYNLSVTSQNSNIIRKITNPDATKLIASTASNNLSQLYKVIMSTGNNSHNASSGSFYVQPTIQTSKDLVNKATVSKCITVAQSENGQPRNIVNPSIDSKQNNSYKRTFRFDKIAKKDLNAPSLSKNVTFLNGARTTVVSASNQQTSADSTTNQSNNNLTTTQNVDKNTAGLNNDHISLNSNNSAVNFAQKELVFRKTALIQLAIQAQLPPYKPQSSYSGPTFQCEECKDTYISEETLKRHKERQSCLFTYDCPGCNTTVQFYNRCVFLIHIRRHNMPIKASNLTISDIQNGYLNMATGGSIEYPQINNGISSGINIEPQELPPHNRSNGLSNLNPIRPVEQKDGCKIRRFEKLRNNRIPENKSGSIMQAQSSAANSSAVIATATVVDQPVPNENLECDSSKTNVDNADENSTLLNNVSTGNTIIDTLDDITVGHNVTIDNENDTEKCKSVNLEDISKIPVEEKSDGLAKQINTYNRYTNNLISSFGDSNAVMSNNKTKTVDEKRRNSVSCNVVQGDSSTTINTTSNGDSVHSGSSTAGSSAIELSSEEEEIESINDKKESANDINTCLDCQKEVSDLRSHYQGLGNPVPLYKCGKCLYLNPTPCALSAHTRMHAQKAPFVCPECGVFFTQTDDFRNHIKNVCFYTHKTIRFECAACQALKTSQQLLITHLESCHLKMLYKCDMCNVSTYNRSAIDAHGKRIHRNQIVTFSEGYSCEICPELFIPERSTHAHLIKHIYDEKCLKYIYNCICCRSFTCYNKESYAAHIRTCFLRKLFPLAQKTVGEIMKESICQKNLLKEYILGGSLLQKEVPTKKLEDMIKVPASQKNLLQEYIINETVRQKQVSTTKLEDVVTDSASQKKTSSEYIANETLHQKELATKKLEDIVKESAKQKNSLNEYINKILRQNDVSTKKLEDIVNDSASQKTLKEYILDGNLHQKDVSTKKLEDNGKDSASQNSLLTEYILNETLLQKVVPNKKLELPLDAGTVDPEIVLCDGDEYTDIDNERLQKEEDKKFSKKDPLIIEKWEAKKLKNQTHAEKICVMCRQKNVQLINGTLFCNNCCKRFNADGTIHEEDSDKSTEDGRRMYKCRLCQRHLNRHWKTIRLHYENFHYGDFDNKSDKKNPFKTKLTDLDKFDTNQDQDTTTSLRKRTRRQKSKIPSKISKIAEEETIPAVEEDSPTKSKNQENVKVLPKMPGKSSDFYKCIKCTYTSQDQLTFQSHIQTHKSPLDFQCLECGECFVVKPSLEKHLIIIHNVKNVKDYLSQKKIKTEPSSELDVKLEENQCEVCFLKCDSKQSFEKHIRIHGMAFVTMHSRAKDQTHK